MNSITVYGTNWCPDCKRAKKFFGEQRVSYEYVDIEQEPRALTYVEKVNNGKQAHMALGFSAPSGHLTARPSGFGSFPI